ncbi:MAG TPA: hypothetical protein VGD78_15640 [Chthoniobacterales bacterium]
MNRFCHRHQLFASRCYLVSALTLGAALIVSYAQELSGLPASLTPGGGGVHGSLFVRVQNQTTTAWPSASTARTVYLPDFEVYLRNVVTGRLSRTVKTNPFGRFAIPTQEPGTYELRWNAQRGWQGGVLAKPIVITNGTEFPGSVEVKPLTSGGLLIGQVKRADGGAPWVHEEFFGVECNAQVAAQDSNGNLVAEPVHANAFGGFAMAGLPKAFLQVRATIEAAASSQAVAADALSFGGPAVPVTLTVNERPPQILSLAATVNQIAVRSVAPGATVTLKVEARSFGQAALRFNWRLQEGMGALSPAGASATWRLPSTPGPYTAYVLVSDGSGGYATGSAGVLVGMTQPEFDGPALLERDTNPADAGEPYLPIPENTGVRKDYLHVHQSPGISTGSMANGTFFDSILPADAQIVVTSPAGRVVSRPFAFPLGPRGATISNLLPGTNFKLQVFAKLPGPLNAGVIGTPIPNVTFANASRRPLAEALMPSLSPLPDNVVHTGTARQDCLGLTVTQYPAPTDQSFLNLVNGTDPGNATLATAYNDAVDPSDPVHGFPGGRRATLGRWWATNGFDANGKAADDVRTAYLNDNDLGSGRDMHVLRHPDGTVAAYVTNFVDLSKSANGEVQGEFNQNPAYADSAASKNPARRAATVCMEWAPIENQDPRLRVVKFFVYAGNGNGADATIQTNVDLDGHGPKFVPQLCLNCHGGTYAPQNPQEPTLSELNMGASFREFDLATFRFPGDRDVPDEPEKTAFKRQNLIVRGRNVDTSLSAPAIKNLINGWYGIGEISLGNNNVLYVDPHPTVTSQNHQWNPPGWNANPSLYHNVVAKSCRTCHVAFASDDPQFGITWTTLTQFKNDAPLIGDYVFGGKIMPHSQVTYKNFWNNRDPGEAETLKRFTDANPGTP